VKQEIAAMSPQDQANVPGPLQPTEVADAVVALVEDNTLAVPGPSDVVRRTAIPHRFRSPGVSR